MIHDQMRAEKRKRQDHNTNRTSEFIIIRQSLVDVRQPLVAAAKRYHLDHHHLLPWVQLATPFLVEEAIVLPLSI